MKIEIKEGSLVEHARDLYYLIKMRFRVQFLCGLVQLFVYILL